MAEQILFGIDISGIDQALGKELTKALMSDQNRLKKVFSAALADATKKGTEDGLEASKVEEYLGQAFSRGEATLAKAAALYAKASQTTDEKARKAMEQRAAAMRKAVEDESAARMKTQMQIIERHGKAIKQWEEFQNKSVRERIELTSKGLKDAWSALKSGDAAGLGDLLGSGASLLAGGAARSGVAAAGAGSAGGAAAGAGAAGAAAGLGTAAAALAAVAIPLAAVAGTLALVVKIVMDAVNQTKQFNKALLESAGAGDFMMGNMNDGVNDFVAGMSTARRAATDFVFNVKWGTVADDLFKIQTAANDAGLTFKEMAGDTTALVNGMTGLTGHMELALRYSQLLGVSSTEVAEQMGKWQTDLGLGLKSLEERFATITKLAMESGFGVKRFYTMVGQATTGVALYNVRIEEAARLLKLTGEVLGESEAADFIQTLQKGFSGEDYPTRLKRVMLTGMEDTRAIVAKSAELTGEKLAGDFAQPLQKAMENIGMGEDEIALSMSGKGLVDQLGKMSGEQQRELMYQLQQQGSQGEQAARDLRHVIKMGQAAASGSSDQLADALAHLDMGAKLAMLMDPQILGNDKMIDSMDGMQKHILAQTQNLTPEMIEKLGAMQTNLRAQYDQAKKSGEFVGDFRDYVQEYGNREEELAGAMTQQEYLAQASVEATRDLSNVMENGVQYILEKIFGLLEGMFHTLTGMSDSEVEAKGKAIAASESQLAGLLQAQELTRGELEKAKEAEATATDKTSKKEAKDRVAELTELLSTQEAQSTLKRRQISEMQSVGSAGWRDLFGERDQRGFEVEAMARAKSRYGSEGISEELASLGKTGALVGEGEMRGQMGGLHGAITEGARATEAAGYAKMQDPTASLGGRAMGAGMAAVGGLFRWAGDTDIDYAKQQGEAEALVDGTEAIAEREMAQQAEIAEEQRRQEEESLKNQKDAKKEQERLRRQMPDLFAEGLQMHEVRGALAAAGVQLTPENIQKFLGNAGEGEAAAIRQRVAMGLQARGKSAEAFGTAGALLPAVEDFIYRGSGGAGTITPINTADQFFGAKPGGPIDNAVGASGRNININIHGGDTQKIYQTVKQALAASGR